MTAGHSHGHSHDGHGAIGWDAFRTNRVLQAAAAIVVAAAVATVILITLLWPDAGARDDALNRGAEVGLGSERYAADVVQVLDGPCSYSTEALPQDCRTVAFEVTEGRFIGERQYFPEFSLELGTRAPDVAVGDAIIAGFEPSTDFWFYADRDRRTPLVLLAVLFAIVVVALGRFRGLAALAGMAVTVVVLIGFVAPSVLAGNDPLLVAVTAAAAIAFVSLYLTHGFNATTTVALAGTLLSLGLTLALAAAFFSAARFTGLATEDALILPFIAGDIDLAGLLLGGAVLGTLGALDDVTVTQVATVAELHHRSPLLGFRELVASGIRVGREHIASTVNTLLLAYAGASMPLLLLFAVSEQPLAQVANSELVAVEIVRTLCGSIGLVAAVPITTTLAALTARDNRDSAEAVPPVAHPQPDLKSAIAPQQDPSPTPRWDDFGPTD